MKQYETTIVLDAGVEESLIESEIEKINQIIKENGGKIADVERWGVRRFAYELKKRHQGYYIHIRFLGSGSTPDKLVRHYRMDENILRFMTVVSQIEAVEAKTIEKEDSVEESVPEAEIDGSEVKATADTEPITEEKEIADEAPPSAQDNEAGETIESETKPSEEETKE